MTPTTLTAKSESAAPAGWFRVWNAAIGRLAEIGPLAFAVYCILAKHADRAGRCYPSIPRIASLVGVGERGVRKAIRKLASAGLVEVIARCDEEGRRSSNIYHLLPPSPPKLPGTRRQGPLNQETPGPGTDSRGDPEPTATRDPEPGAGGTRPILNYTHLTKPIEPSSCRKLRFDEADLATARWMFGRIRAIHAPHKEPNWKAWANSIRLMREQDKRTDADIRDL